MKMTSLKSIVTGYAFILLLGLTTLSIWGATPVLAKALVPARGVILLNLDSGRILFEQNADLAIPPASLAKIMTMFLALDAVDAKKIRLNKKISVRPSAARIGGSRMGLATGDKVPLVRLLSGMAVMSGNDAATAVAEAIGGNERAFVNRMNSRAKSLGLSNTRYKNPTGLPASGQQTSARDVMKLCQAYLKKHPDALRFHKMNFLLHKGAVMRNTNPLLGTVAGVDGMKTGWTVASGYNLVVTAKKGKTRLLAVILGAKTKEDRYWVGKKLIDAGFLYPGKPGSVKLALAK